MSILDQPSRPTIADSEWEITARLMRDGKVVVESTAPLYLTDSWLNGTPKGSKDRVGRLTDAGRNIAKWVDDLAQGRARAEAAQRKASKRK